MLLVAIVLFIIAALFGLFVLVHILRNKPTPKAFVFIHGSIAVIAVLIVAYATFLRANPWLIASLSVFIIAALGGLTLFSFDMSKKPIPKLLAVVHPLVAVIGLLILIAYVIQ